ncbi:MAG: lipocalin family protein, partial [Chloroflexi bacterium]|nr:lipocalin family protein [Chloroflexota bacterium]
VAIGWDWASVQLDDGTDLMLTRVFDAGGVTVESYATLRQGDGPARLLSVGEFTFAPAGPTWTSERTGTSYATIWRVAVPGAVDELTLEPLVGGNEFVSAARGLVYWEAGVEVRASDGRVVGQGFVELNWPLGATP